MNGQSNIKTCGEYLVTLLVAYGVDTVFGIPGVHTVELYRGLPSSGIRHITPRHEQGAGFMADGYARTKGKIAACFIITGPGMTNILTAMGQAYADSIPMLVISSVNHSHSLGMQQGRLHEMPQQSQTVSGVTAFSHTLLNPQQLPQVLARAFSIFQSARPRPVHIEIPIDIITAPVDLSKQVAPVITSFHKPAPNSQQLQQAIDLLVNAKNPMLLLGGGCAQAYHHTPAIKNHLVELAELLAMPTTYTINAKGIFPAKHPLSLGCNQSFIPVRERIAKADVVLAIGTELAETDYDVVFDGKFDITGQIIRLDIDAKQLNSNFVATVGIVCDAALGVEQLLTQLKPALDSRSTNIDITHAQQQVKDIRQSLHKNILREWHVHHKVLTCIKQQLNNVIIVGDSTQPVYSGNHLYETNTPNTWFNSATGFGTLGYALPAAIGAKIAKPNCPVVALIGDGGCQFTLPELASAIEANAPIIMLLWNNQGYGEIKHYMQQRGLPQIGVDIYTPNFALLAQGFGCHYVQPNSFAKLEEALATAGRADKTTVIEINQFAEFLRVDEIIEN